MEDDTIAIVGAVGLFIGGFLAFLAFGYFMDSYECHSKYSSFKAEYGIFSGCRIEWNGKITPVDIIREIN